jgi:hypothetical protein
VPGCSEPRRWPGGFAHLKRVIELAPDDELARRKLVVLVWGCVGFASYELPLGTWPRSMRILGALSEAGVLLQTCQATTADRLLPRLRRSGD